MAQSILAMVFTFLLGSGTQTPSEIVKYAPSQSPTVSPAPSNYMYSPSHSPSVSPAPSKLRHHRRSHLPMGSPTPTIAPTPSESEYVPSPTPSKSFDRSSHSPNASPTPSKSFYRPSPTPTVSPSAANPPSGSPFNSAYPPIITQSPTETPTPTVSPAPTETPMPALSPTPTETPTPKLSPMATETAPAPSHYMHPPRAAPVHPKTSPSPVPATTPLIPPAASPYSAITNSGDQSDAPAPAPSSDATLNHFAIRSAALGFFAIALFA